LHLAWSLDVAEPLLDTVYHHVLINSPEIPAVVATQLMRVVGDKGEHASFLMSRGLFELPARDRLPL
jgi:hypothetical protein